MEGWSSLIFFITLYLQVLSATAAAHSSTIKFVITADAKSGPIGKVDCPSKRRCRFQISTRRSFSKRRRQDLLSVGSVSGLISLKKQPKRSFLFNRRKRGIQEISTRIRVQRSSKIIIVRLVILPVGYGDSFLKGVGTKIRRDNLVRKSETFRTSRGALHRFLRIIAERVDPVGSARAFGAIKEEKGIKFSNVDVVSQTENGKSKSKGEKEYLIFSMNSLYSKNALERLKKDASCSAPEVPKCPRKDKFRTIDGTCNNLDDPLLGSAPRAFDRLVPAIYFDSEGLNDPIGFPDQPLAPEVPSPFEVVRDFIIKQETPGKNKFGSHAVMQWGQWLDHDLDLTPESESSDECQDVPCDGSRDDFFPPCFTIEPIPGFDCIRFARSAAADCQIKNGQLTVREQLNINTAYIDGSQVYGSTETLATELRDLTSRGLLRVEPGVNGDFLPTDEGELVAPDSFCRDTLFGRCFLAGDSRASEQQVLASTHTLFVREHNRIAKELGNIHSSWNGERIYQEARRILGAVLQKITYKDYLSIIIGNTLPKYEGYDPSTVPDVANSFATAAYRFGHSTIRPAFDILDSNFDPIADPLPLGTLFFNNTFIILNGIDPLLLGLLKNGTERVDRKLAAPLLNELFEREDSPALNLAALNIQRGRDHGLPGYNAFRRFCGLRDAKSFRDTRKQIRSKLNRKLLADLYNDKPELADLWPAGLAEVPANGGTVGETFGCIIREQLRRARDGDRFYYENTDYFSPAEIAEIEKTTLSRILCDNLETIVSVQKNAFIVENRRGNRRVTCDRIPGMDLSVFRKEKDNPCDPNPCFNSGRCYPQRKSRYTCSCTSGYFGKKCNKQKNNPCNPNPCLNSGRCNPRGRSRYTCSCAYGYFGKRCNKRSWQFR